MDDHPPSTNTRGSKRWRWTIATTLALSILAVLYYFVLVPRQVESALRDRLTRSDEIVIRIPNSVEDRTIRVRDRRQIERLAAQLRLHSAKREGAGARVAAAGWQCLYIDGRGEDPEWSVQLLRDRGLRINLGEGRRARSYSGRLKDDGLLEACRTLFADEVRGAHSIFTPPKTHDDFPAEEIESDK